MCFTERTFFSPARAVFGSGMYRYALAGLSHLASYLFEPGACAGRAMQSTSWWRLGRALIQGLLVQNHIAMMNDRQ